ncbi:MAG: hypothetical protein QOJ54_1746, partial [Aliidongia sp.]|nr:hypothetical protein [Aliidongia sp.]
FLGCLAIIYSFAIGPIIIVAHFVYGTLIARRVGLGRGFHLRWFGLHAALAALAVPVIANSVLRGAGHALSPDAAAVASTLTDLAVGTHAGRLGLWTVPALAILGLAGLAALVTVATARDLLIAYLVLPLALVFAVSHAVTPIWLTRAFVFAVPVFAVAIGRALGDWRYRIPWPILAAAAGCMICLQGATAYRNESVPKEPDYAALMAEFRSRMAAGDCLVAFQGLDAFWGAARYFAGPDWGDALAIQAPPAGRWVRIMAAVPPTLASRLGWTALSDRFEHDGIHLIAGDPPDLSQTCGRIFLIGKTPEFSGPAEALRDAPVVAASGWVSIRGPMP